MVAYQVWAESTVQPGGCVCCTLFVIYRNPGPCLGVKSDCLGGAGVYTPSVSGNYGLVLRLCANVTSGCMKDTYAGRMSCSSCHTQSARLKSGAGMQPSTSSSRITAPSSDFRHTDTSIDTHSVLISQLL